MFRKHRKRTEKEKERLYDENVFFNNCFTETFCTSSFFCNFALFKFEAINLDGLKKEEDPSY